MGLVTIFGKGDTREFEKIDKNMFIFGITSILSISIVDGGVFNTCLNWI